MSFEHSFPTTAAAQRDPMHTSGARVGSGPVARGGWKGRLSIDGDQVRVVSPANGKQLSLDLSQVRRATRDPGHGLWMFRLTDGREIWIKSAGSYLSSDRTAAGHRTNELISERLADHGIRIFSI